MNIAINAIQAGKLMIVAKIGELAPAKSRAEAGSEGGRGKEKGGALGAPPFSKHTIADYRKVAANKEELPKYIEAGADDSFVKCLCNQPSPRGA